MKKLVYIVSLLATAALAVVSCQQKEEPHQPGPQEAAGCYGVFFPTQEASGSHVYNPTQDKSVDITLKRTNSKGAITVPIKATYSEEGIFNMGEVSFADGQDETVFTVRFDSAKDGVNYTASFLIDDNNYASLYASNPVSLDFSFMCVEMKDLMTEDGSQKAALTFTDKGFWGEAHNEVYIQYYEVDNVRYCETTGGKLYEFYGSAGTEGEGPWGTDVQLKFKWHLNKTVTINDVDYQWIEVEPQYHGWDAANGPVYFGDYFYMRQDMGLSNGDFTSSYDRYVNGTDGYLPSYYDGHGGFIFNMAYWIHGTTSWYGYKNDAPVGIAEGYTRVDYSIKASQAGVSEEGVVPVTFILGADVAKVVYTFAEGSLTATQVANAIAVLDFNSKDAITDGSGTYGFNLGTTGTYTLVAATYNEKGEQQASTSCEVVYLAAGDEKEYAVVINGGIGSAAKYVPQGVNTDNSLEIFVYGENIVAAKMAAFSYSDLISNYDGCVESLMAEDDVKAKVIEAINGEGYVDVMTGLLPGTEYYLLVYASNGYSETVKYFGSEYTTGDPLPIYKSFTVGNYNPDYAASDCSALEGIWNYYGIDLDESLGLREYLGKVKVVPTGEQEPYEGEDGNVYYEQGVKLTGLSAGSVAAAQSYDLVDTDDDTVEFSFDTDGGLLYVSSYWAAGYETYDTAPFYFTQYASTAGAWYRATYYMAGIPVDDGYIAFVDVSGSGYEFNAWRFMAGGYRWLSVQDPLLVDPSKDNNGVAPASVDVKINQAKKLIRESAKEVNNCVLTEKGRIHAVMEKYNQKQKNAVRSFSNTLGIEGAERSVRMVTPKSSNYMGPATIVSVNRNELEITSVR